MRRSTLQPKRVSTGRHVGRMPKPKPPISSSWRPRSVRRGGMTRRAEANTTDASERLHRLGIVTVPLRMSFKRASPSREICYTSNSKRYAAMLRQLPAHSGCKSCISREGIALHRHSTAFNIGFRLLADSSQESLHLTDLAPWALYDFDAQLSLILHLCHMGRFAGLYIYDIVQAL